MHIKYDKVTIALSLIIIPIFLIQSNVSCTKNFESFGLFFDTQKQTILTYLDNNFKFQINYPNNWEKAVKINNEITFVAPKETDQSSNPAGVVIKIMPVQSKNISIESAAKALVSSLKADHKDFKIESSKYYKISGKKAIQIVFTATDKNLQKRKAMQIIAINNNKIFIITYKASIDKYTKYEDTLKDMINSFKFL